MGFRLLADAVKRLRMAPKPRTCARDFPMPVRGHSSGVAGCMVRIHLATISSCGKLLALFKKCPPSSTWGSSDPAEVRVVEHRGRRQGHVTSLLALRLADSYRGRRLGWTGSTEPSPDPRWSSTPSLPDRESSGGSRPCPARCPGRRSRTFLVSSVPSPIRPRWTQPCQRPRSWRRSSRRSGRTRHQAGEGAHRRECEWVGRSGKPASRLRADWSCHSRSA